MDLERLGWNYVLPAALFESAGHSSTSPLRAAGMSACCRPTRGLRLPGFAGGQALPSTGTVQILDTASRLFETGVAFLPL